MLKTVVYEIIEDLIKDGKFFSASVTKKDGTERIMNCRTNVKKHLKGGKLNYDARKAFNFIVWDRIAKGYRTIKLDALNWIQIDGKKYNFDHINLDDE